MTHTEWGVRSPYGEGPVENLEMAELMVKNLNTAGYASEVIWRGVTEWQKRDGLDD
jgi:hypothetical protein